MPQNNIKSLGNHNRRSYCHTEKRCFTQGFPQSQHLWDFLKVISLAFHLRESPNRETHKQQIGFTVARAELVLQQCLAHLSCHVTFRQLPPQVAMISELYRIDGETIIAEHQQLSWLQFLRFCFPFDVNDGIWNSPKEHFWAICFFAHCGIFGIVLFVS